MSYGKTCEIKPEAAFKGKQTIQSIKACGGDGGIHVQILSLLASTEKRFSGGKINASPIINISN